MAKTRKADSTVLNYFAEPSQALHRQYLALRSFIHDEESAETVAMKFGYTTSTVYTLARDFTLRLASASEQVIDPFFHTVKPGRQSLRKDDELIDAIIAYRKKQLSIPDIKIFLDGQGYDVSEGFIYKICDENGFARLPKRSRNERHTLMAKNGYSDILKAPEAEVCSFNEPVNFSSKGVGVLCFLPVIKMYGIDKVIYESTYPGTSQIPKLNAILAFLALKLSNFARYGQDDGWCMDRGLGMFAGLNVLPKTTWYSTYSAATERKDNLAFLKALNQIYAKHELLSDTVNLDFTAIPYWGDPEPFENNWSGKRSKALISIQAALAQDADSGLICYGDTTVKHDNQDNVVLEFLDFYKTNQKVEYLTFDSKFTTLTNLGRINDEGIKFITIQRKSKNLNIKISEIPSDEWKTIKVERSNNKSRTVTYSESRTTNKLYGESELRQIFIKGNHIKPATIITNDFTIKAKDLLRKYAKRWLVELGISEMIHFFHLNKNNSGIVIKVDFDLTMTILAHNLYRLLAAEIPGYSHYRAQAIYDTFIDNFGDIHVEKDTIIVKLNRKRSLPHLRDAISEMDSSFSWLGNKKMIFTAHTHS